jgi:hypothetical protein
MDYERHAYGGIWGGANTSAHHNLIAHCNGRMPRFDGIRNSATELVDFRNNVIYNWGSYNTNGGEGGTYNIVNNYYKYGPNTTSTVSSGVNKRSMLINPYKQTTAPVLPFGTYYMNGNYCDNSATVTANNWLGATFSGGTLADSATSKAATPFPIPSVVTETATDAYNSVLAKAGCTLPNRDTLDKRIVNDVINRTGGMIDCQGNNPHGTPYNTSQTAWPALATGTTQTDTDHDGMPDSWEDARGLNKNLATDLNGYIASNGYNNIENYINGDTIVAVGQTNSCITAKKINANNSGGWLLANDSTTSNYLSAKYTASVDSNQVVAAILNNGNFGEFTVSYFTTNSDRLNAGRYYARRNITIVPTTPAAITTPVTVRLYLSLSEFNALKAVDNSISSINDVQVMKSNDNSCITVMPATVTSIQPVATALFGSYQNGYSLEFSTSSFGSFFFQSKNVATGVNNLAASEKNLVKIYPDPVKDFFMVTVTGETNFDLVIFDMLGNKINSYKTVANQSAIHIHALPSGTYILQVKTKNKTINTKFSKQ